MLQSRPGAVKRPVSLTTLLQAIASGVLLGCLYSPMALGFALELGFSRALNPAQGEMEKPMNDAVWLAPE